MLKIIGCFCIILLLVTACSDKAKKADSEDEIEYAGVKVSAAQRDENNKIIHNIFNFDTTEKTVNVTTLCLDIYNNVISDDDSYIMTLPPESISGWEPECPEDTANYRIDIEDITE